MGAVRAIAPSEFQTHSLASAALAACCEHATGIMQLAVLLWTFLKEPPEDRFNSGCVPLPLDDIGRKLEAPANLPHTITSTLRIQVCHRASRGCRDLPGMRTV